MPARIYHVHIHSFTETSLKFYQAEPREASNFMYAVIQIYKRQAILNLFLVNINAINLISVSLVAFFEVHDITEKLEN